MAGNGHDANGAPGLSEQLAHYFAFGSNMSTTRLQERIAAAQPIGRGRLLDWQLVCDKTGIDGSAKANLRPCAGAVTWGVMFALPHHQLARLDQFEGGYQRRLVSVLDDLDCARQCHTYTSTRTTCDERPFGWYRQHMLDGAREHRLPDAHIAWIAALTVLPG